MQDLLTARAERAAEVKLRVEDVRALALDGTFEGYASVFNRRDMGSDVVLPGAFRRSVASRGAANIRMLFQHDPAQPIGVWERIYEDARGLFVRGRLTTEIARARDVLALMRAGAIDGLSIGFRAVKGRRDARTGIRTLAEIDLWEISIVTFPMQPEARVAASLGSAATDHRPTDDTTKTSPTADASSMRRQARVLLQAGRRGSHAADETGGWQARLITQMATAAALLRHPRRHPDRNQFHNQ